MGSSQNKEDSLKKLVDTKRLPVHVAIIMDGNGRWAKNHSFPRIRGHRQGIRAVRDATRASRSLGIKVLSLYAFSEENWNRPKSEVSALMNLLKKYLIKERKELMDNDIRLIATGNLDRLPADVRKELENTFDRTSGNKSMILNLALSYSGRGEIVRAINRFVKEISTNGKNTEIDSNTFSNYLDTANLPDPDLLVRTSGEQRISNFMLWQIAYAEIYVTEILWPDFRTSDFYEAIIEFQKRERRFGLTSEQLPKDDLTNKTY